MWISKSLTLKNIVKLYLKTDKLFRFLLQALPISRKKTTGKACEARALYALKILTPRFSDFEKKLTVLQESTRTCTDYLNRRKKENRMQLLGCFGSSVSFVFSLRGTRGTEKGRGDWGEKKKDPFSFSRFSSPSIPSPFLGLSSRLFV